MSRNAPGGNAALPYVLTGSKESVKEMQDIVARQLARDPFAQFMGEGSDNCVLTVGESSKEGSSCKVFFDSDLTGDGVSGNQNLDENIDEDNVLAFYFRGDLMANSFESPVDKLKTRSALGKIRRKEKLKLVKWFALRTVKEKFYTLSHAATNAVFVKANGDKVATASALAAGDTFNTYVLDELLSRAEDNWVDASGNEHPTLDTSYMEKTDAEGHGIEQYGDFYPVFVGPKSYASLENDPRWIEHQKIKKYGNLSSYVKGFAGVYKNAVIIKVPRNSKDKAGIIRSDSPDFTGKSGSYTGFDSYKAGGDVVTEINFIMGTGALALGFDPEPRYAENPTWDSNRKVLFWADQFFGAKKIRFMGETTEEKKSIYHDKDHGVIVAVSTVK